MWQLYGAPLTAPMPGESTLLALPVDQSWAREETREARKMAVTH
jgi:hypothetical protein